MSLINIENRDQPLATLDYPILPVPLGEFIPQPVWAADSASVLLTVAAKEGLDPDLPPWPMASWRVPVDGTAPAVVGQFSDDRALASFSSDQKRLAYFTREGEADWRLHLAGVDLA